MVLAAAAKAATTPLLRTSSMVGRIVLVTASAPIRAGQSTRTCCWVSAASLQVGHKCRLGSFSTEPAFRRLVSGRHGRKCGPLGPPCGSGPQPGAVVKRAPTVPPPQGAWLWPLLRPLCCAALPRSVLLETINRML